MLLLEHLNLGWKVPIEELVFLATYKPAFNQTILAILEMPLCKLSTIYFILGCENLICGAFFILQAHSHLW